MKNPISILRETSHRYYPIPKKPWKYYQEWNNVLFLHWEVATEEIESLLPDGLILDTCNGKAYISLVLFTVRNLHIGKWIAPDYVGSFQEINLRTYVVHNGIPGIFLLSAETDKRIVSWLSRLLLGIPYTTAEMKRHSRLICSNNVTRGYSAGLRFKASEEIMEKKPIDCWLTERHCLYRREGTKLYRYDIHHQEWALHPVQIKIKDLQYHVGKFHSIMRPVDFKHYCSKLEVLFWSRLRIG